MRRPLVPVAAILFLALASSGIAQAEKSDKEDKLAGKMLDARAVYEELVNVPEREVPEALLEDCKCIAVIPGVIKGAIGWGFRVGQGVMTCRKDGAWSPPTFLRLTGGSFGFQIGAQGTDIVLFFMTERGARSLLESKFTLGGTASVAAGPMGRSAEAGTDLKLTSEIYSYAKSKGLFAGLSLEGARLSPDHTSNERYYGQAVDPAVLLFEHQAPRMPDEAKALREALP